MPRVGIVVMETKKYSQMPSICSFGGGFSQPTPTESCRDVFLAGTVSVSSPNGSVSFSVVGTSSALGDSVMMVTPGGLTSNSLCDHHES